MKEKIITIKVDGALQGQWSSLLLELNLIKRAWKSYGVDINMKAPGLKNVLTHGTRVNDGSNTCLLYTSPSPRDQRGARMPSSA